MEEISDTHIYIPSTGRSGEQPTLQALPERWRDHTSLVVGWDDRGSYYENWHSKVHKVLCPIGARGITETRQWVIEKSKARTVIFLSDDLKFFRRGELNEKGTFYHLVDCTTEEIDVMLQWLVDCIQDWGFAHAGISQRQVNHSTLEDYAYVTRMHDAYSYDRDVLLRNDIKYRLPLMEDLDITLQLFEAGYPNVVSFYYAWDQKHSNAEGGCSLYRNNALQSKSAELLAEAHPEVVRIVEKNTKSWKGMEVRKDVRVQWKKAYKGEQFWE